MSLLLAVRDNEDIVIASDGRVQDEACAVLADDSLKTLALNDGVCLGLVGSTNTMRHVLISLEIRCRSRHPGDLLALCQEVACPIDVDYVDARDELTRVMQWLARRHPVSHRRSETATPLLAGRSNGHPALCEWIGDGQASEAGGEGFAEAMAGSLPGEGTSDWNAFRRLIHGEGTTHLAEQRLTRAIRFCARSLGSNGPVSETVHVRRLSKRFALTAPANGLVVAP